MEHLTWTNVNKDEWGEGPWQGEVDKEQWLDEATGLACLIKRNPSFGNLCGYVGVDKAHPLYGEVVDDRDFRVHGGITYANFCQEGDEGHTICHVAEPGEPEPLYWVGFDAAHYMDLCPAYEARHGFDTAFGETYRDIEYMKSECANLAYQLKEAADSDRLD